MKSKMNKLKSSIFINLSFSLLFSLSAKATHFDIPVAKYKSTPTKVYDIKTNISLIKKDKLVEQLRLFVKSTRPSRLIGTPGHKMAQDFILESIKDMEMDTKNLTMVDTFSPDVEFAKKMYWDDFNKQIKMAYRPEDEPYKLWLKYTQNITSFIDSHKADKGKNILWEKRGTLRPNDILVIGAHYDSLVTDEKSMLIKEEAMSPGANKNGSGVTMALALIQHLIHLNLPITVRVVFFDWGEFGFLGSKAFISKYRNEFKDKNFLGLINLDSLGHDSKYLDKEKKFGNMKVYIRSSAHEGHREDQKFAKRLIDLGDKMGASVNFKLMANQFNNSDNVSFWREDFVAATFSGDWENDFDRGRFHSSDDFVETININTFYRAYEFIAGAVTALAFDITR